MNNDQLAMNNEHRAKLLLSRHCEEHCAPPPYGGGQGVFDGAIFFTNGKAGRLALRLLREKRSQ